MESNLRLEREFINSKTILINTTRSNVFIESCLKSSYFNTEEKSFIIESVLPNQKLIQEGGWDWIKDNIIEPTKDAVNKGIEKAKSFYTKLKKLISNIGEFLKKVWSYIVKFGNWCWEKVMGVVKNKINKSKDKITADLEKFKNLPPQERDTELEQLKQTSDFWLSAKENPAGLMMSVQSKEVNNSINGVTQESDELMEYWSPNVINLFGGNSEILNEESSKASKLMEKIGGIISWCLKGPVKLLEWCFSKITQGVFIGCSFVTKKIGGPGTFKFKHLSHLVGATLFTIAEAVVLGSAISHKHLIDGNFITDVIEGWEHHLEHALGGIAGKLVHPLVVTLSGIGVALGVYEIIMAFKHLKGEKDMSQYDKDDLNKDGKVDDLDRKISNTKKSGEYYNQPGFS